MLCGSCLNIFRVFHKRLVELGQPFCHQDSLETLLKSVHQGCEICCQLYNKVTSENLGSFTSQSPITYCYVHPDPISDEYSARYTEDGVDWSEDISQSGRIRLLDLGWPDVKSRAILSYRLESAHDVEEPIRAYVPHRNTGSNTCLNLIKHWVRSCIQMHHGPYLEQPPVWLPTRLIDLGPRTNGDVESGDGFPKLVLSADGIESDRYMTLSHRWGTRKMPRLTRANHDSSLDKIPAASLTKTFEDAMIVVRHLEVRYLWIDLLCIIQNSEEDWRHEASRMGEVYRNSFCNICAMSARDGSEGLFCDRPTESIKSFLVNVEWNEPLGSLYWLTKNGLLDEEAIANAELNTRGWVLQERLLPRRAVLFTEQQILWECQEHEACESLPGGVSEVYRGDAWTLTRPGVKPPFYKFMREVSRLSHYYQAKFVERLLSPAYERYFLWINIVEEFTARNLTNAGDKLAALAGIASELWHYRPYMSSPSRRGEKYLAGLWSHTFMEWQLLWRVVSPQSRRPRDMNAPSWSWASVEGRVKCFRDPNSRQNAERACQRSWVREAVVLMDGDDFAGKVEGGAICIEGPLTSATFVKHDLEDSDNPASAYSGGSIGRLSFGVGDERNAPERENHSSWSSKAPRRSTTPFPLLDVAEPRKPSNYLVIDAIDGDVSTLYLGGEGEIGFWVDERDQCIDAMLAGEIFLLAIADCYVDSLVWGLLLKRTLEREYRRIGCFTAVGCDLHEYFDHNELPDQFLTIV